MASATHYDMIVIGGGTAGLVTSAGSAGIGARVALIEQSRLGGECLWNGCVPSKAMIACARIAHEARNAARFGVAAHDVEVNFSGVTRWVREAQERIAPHDSPDRFRSLGVDVIDGAARFVGERTLTVNGDTLTAKRITIATGSKPAIPSIEGLDKVPYLTNETIFSLEQQPHTLLILGGGPIGLELAQAFARLGTSVQIIEAAAQILPREDRELADMLGACLIADGVTLLLGTKATRVASANGRIQLDAITSDGRAVTLEGDALLVATGRAPNVATLDLEKAGIEANKHGIVVDHTLKTTASDVWAAGDCVGPLRFTHVADYQARLVVRNAFFPFAGKANYDAVPWVTYTAPELAHVGLTENEAREKYGDSVRVWRRKFSDVDRAVTDGHTDGMVKLITTSRGKILGGHILGYGAGNMIGEITIAMRNGLSAAKLANTIHPYPTYPEAIKQAADDFQKSRFTGLVKTIARWFATS
ncbi:MAG: mercuric reductase [Gemmatimonadaceae bacterium]